MKENKNFRTDINNLRAIAVLSVVFYHFKPSVLSGGFVGVDIFFVISGYLMTKIIVSGLLNGSLSIVEFYLSRINRILPPLIFMCGFLFVFGYSFLSPVDFKELSKQIISSILFVSNWTFSNKSGYFDNDSGDFWLLHTWSLSVEWQFYLLYPLTMMLGYRVWREKGVKITIIFLLLLSFFSIFVYNIGNSTANYYSITARMWEMLIGGIVYIYPNKLNDDKLNRILSNIGYVIILCSFIFVDSKMQWPGYITILPVIGTAIVLFSNCKCSNENISNKLLGRIGLWSYSIYLWHWPIVVFGNRIGIENWLYIGFPISIFVGYFSYKYIEIKALGVSLRSGKNRAAGLISIFAIALLIPSTYIYVNKGLIERFSDKNRVIYETMEHSPTRNSCHINKYRGPEFSCQSKDNSSWATIGDSHTVELAYTFAERLKLTSKESLQQFSFSGCRPLLSEIKYKNKCAQWYRDSIDYIEKKESIKKIIIGHRYMEGFYSIGSSGSRFINTEKAKLTLRSFDDIVGRLSASKDKVYIILPIPEIERNINSLSMKNDILGLGGDIVGVSREKHLNYNLMVMEHFESANYSDNVYFIDPTSVLCEEDDCYAIKSGISLYFDDNHLSLSGAKKIAETIPVN